MANNKRTVDSVVSDAERLAQVWGENTKFSMGDLTLTSLNSDIIKLRMLKQSREQARVDLSKLVDDTNDQNETGRGLHHSRTQCDEGDFRVGLSSVCAGGRHTPKRAQTSLIEEA